MKTILRTLIVLAIFGGIAAAAYLPIKKQLAERNRPHFREVEVTQGPIRLNVNATGSIKPRLSVHIGSFVSGPIIELNADFNDTVKAGQILARIDPAIYQAAVMRDQASLATRHAEVDRVQALLQQAINDENRALELFQEDEDFISDAEMDRLHFNRKSMEAQLVVAQAAVAQAEANLTNSQANLNYTEIKASHDGIVIDRKIDPGQTLAAQFQTPELFVLGVDMRKEMHIYASVDEADIGQIRKAQANDQPVRFRVDAYPDELFEGHIKEIRLSSTEVQNVITYPVVVVAENPDLKLLPGMTANLTFQVEERPDCRCIPWSAVRFFPTVDLVRPEDRHLIEGRDKAETNNESGSTEIADAEELVEANKKRLQRHVWIREGDKLRAVKVRLGIGNYRVAELVEGDLRPGQKLVIGVRQGSRDISG